MLNLEKVPEMKRALIIIPLLLLIASPTKAVVIRSSQQQFSDDIWRIFDGTDPTKQLAFEVSGLTTDTTRTWTIPDYDVVANAFIDWTNASANFKTTGSGEFGEIKLSDENYIGWWFGGGRVSYILGRESGKDIDIYADEDVSAVAGRNFDITTGGDVEVQAAGTIDLRAPKTQLIPGWSQVEISESGGRPKIHFTMCARGSVNGIISSSGGHTTVDGRDVSADGATLDGKPDLGETSTTAYRGDRGKTAYDYSQVSHLPLAGGTLTGDLAMGDGIKTKFGTGADIEFYYNGTDDEMIYDPALPTGRPFVLERSNLIVRTDPTWEGWARELLKIDSGHGTDTLIAFGGYGSAGNNMNNYAYIGKAYDDALLKLKVDTNRVGINIPASGFPQATLDVRGNILTRGTNPKLIIQNDTLNQADSGALDFVEDLHSFGEAGSYGFRIKLDGIANDLIIQSGNGTTVNDRFSIDRDTGNTVIAGTLTVNGDQSGAEDHVFDDYDDIELLEKWRRGGVLPFATGDILNRDRLLRDTIIQLNKTVKEQQKQIDDLKAEVEKLKAR